MAAYGALVSLSHLLQQTLHPPPLFNNINTISTEQIELLRGKIELLIDFLETYPSSRSEEIADMETRIRDAAYAAEDIIESPAVDRFHSSQSYPLAEGIQFQTVLEKFLSIEKGLLKMRVIQGVGDLQFRNSTAAPSSRSPLPGGKITTVGIEHHSIRITSQLASDESSRQIIPIVGMGGIGKTTLAISVYNNPFVVEHFHARAWVTVSQEYNVQELLLRLFSQINELYPDEKESSNDEVGLQLHKKLFERKYLIVMDDMWDIQAWEGLKMFLPDNGNGSRVLVTSRLSNLADDFGSYAPYKMDFLDEGHSWELFCKTIFVEEDCPIELVEIGKCIVERCGGLPLALLLISGLLAKFERTRQQWVVFARNMSSALNFGRDEQVMKILSLSYTHLPVHLKPCFLYLSMFPEDYEIRVSVLIKLWVAEGLIKPSQCNVLEEIAREHLEDLVSRNVILVVGRGSMGNVTSCKLHDLVRDLCITRAEKENFVRIVKFDNPNIETARRLTVSASDSEQLRMSLQSASVLTRSWLRINKVYGNKDDRVLTFWERRDVMVEEVLHNRFRLLKVVHENKHLHSIKLLNSINLQYVYTYAVRTVLPMPLCWNLQSLLLPRQEKLVLPPEIWLMTQLRHIKIGSFTLHDPPDDGQNVIVLENLQTIKGIEEFKCLEHVIRRIPNLKKLKVGYSLWVNGQAEKFCLHNLVCFKKLESLRIAGIPNLWRTIAFPISLKKLSLSLSWVPWEDLSIVGSLPNLEVLKLKYHATKGEEWNPIEGQFCRLKLLFIWRSELKFWGAENYHFPCLEHLILKEVPLGMIPMSFSEILTLQQIDLQDVNDSMWTSAREISNEREELGYESLLLQRNQY